MLNVPVRLNYESKIEKRQLALLDSIWKEITSIASERGTATSKKAEKISKILGTEFTPDMVDYFSSLRRKEEIYWAVQKSVKNIYRDGFLSSDSLKGHLVGNSFTIVRNGKEEPFTKELVSTTYDVYQRLNDAMESQFENVPRKAKIGIMLGKRVLVPNLIPDWESTDRIREQQVNTVNPFSDYVVKDERIVGLHEKVTPDIARKLRTLEYILHNEPSRKTIVRDIIGKLGYLILTVIIISLWFFYTLFYYPAIWREEKHFITLVGLIVLIVLSMEVIQLTSLPFELLPIGFAAVLIAILWGGSAAAAAVVLILFLIAFSHRIDPFSILTVGAPAMVLALGSSVLKTRSHIYQPIVLAVAVGVFALVISDYTEAIGWLQILQRAGITILGVSVAPLLSFLLLSPMERLTGSCTIFTLQDYASGGHPLMQQLSVEAPGTYQHSLLVADIAEAAAQAIGANALLCRVGGLFHDIGKLTHPEYFHENENLTTAHHEISPYESFRIISGHTKDGVEIARGHKLPQPVIDIIAQHHGTSVMEFFYRRAKAQNPDITDEQFRYQGPKPQNIEAGIIMLSDVCEAAVRSMEVKTPEQIKTVVEQLIKQRIEDGQLSECPIKVRDIAKIEQIIWTRLLAAHHQRSTGNSSQANFLR